MTESDDNTQDTTTKPVKATPKKQLSPERLEQLRIAREKASEKRRELAGVKQMEKLLKDKEIIRKKRELQHQLEVQNNAIESIAKQSKKQDKAKAPQDDDSEAYSESSGELERIPLPPKRKARPKRQVSPPLSREEYVSERIPIVSERIPIVSERNPIVSDETPSRFDNDKFKRMYASIFPS